MNAVPPPQLDDNGTSLGRRSALVVVIGGVGALLSASAAMVAGFLSNALSIPRDRPWIRVGLAEDLDPDTFHPFVVRVERRHAWIRHRVPMAIFVKDLYPKDPLALLATCSHLGCAVHWQPGERRFKCPCHGGVYDEAGRVVSGPPPRPLTRLEVKIENDIVFVRLPTSPQEGAAT